MEKFQLCCVLFTLFMFFWDDAVCQECKEFPTIQEADYDRTYSSISESGKRPLGFVREMVPYNTEGASNPCYLLKDIQGKPVEIMFETIPQQKLCFRNLANQTACYDTRHVQCILPVSGVDRVIFSCDLAQGCSESSVNFWLRITVGPKNDNEGMWCMNRTHTYPEDLRPLPSGFIPITTTPVPSKGSALDFTGYLGLLVAMMGINYFSGKIWI